jgi:phosphate transport system substrate-binding protein
LSGGFGPRLGIVGARLVARPEKGTALRLKFRTVVGLGITVAALAVPVSASATTLLASGSSAELPIITALQAGYKHVVPSVKIVYTADGGNAGVKDVQDKTSQFAVNTRAPLPSDGGTTQFKLFLDGLCVAVNPSNHLKNLSIKHTANIFTDVFTNWSQVSGSNKTTTIDPIGRDSAAGSYTFFQQAVLNGATQSSNVQQLASDGLVATAIKGDPNAIGYVGLAHTGKGSGIKTLKLNNVACDSAQIKTQKYPLSRFIWGVLPSKKPSKAAEKFLDWVRTSHAAGKIIAKAGAVPAFNKKK